MSKQITREQMLAEAQQKVQRHSEWAARADEGSFARRGAEDRQAQAQAMVRRMERGGTPTTAEVVGYFGKGARFSE